MSSQNPAGGSADKASIESGNDSVTESADDHAAEVTENSDLSAASTEAAVDSVVPMTDEDAVGTQVDDAAVERTVARGSKGSLITILLLAVVAVGGGLFGITWLRDAPLREAAAALDEAEPDAEIALFKIEEFLLTEPENPQAMAIKARALVELQRNPREALRLFDIVKASNAAESHAWAKALMMEQQWASAAPLLKQVVAETPNNADAWYELTSCRVRMGNLKSALESAQRLGEFPEMKLRSYYLLASLYADMRESEKAEDYFARILDEVSSTSDETLEGDKLLKALDEALLVVTAYQFYLDYGRTLLEVGKPEAAIRQIAVGIEAERTANGMPSPESCVLMGNAAEQYGNMDGAIRFWDQAVQIDPRNQPARELLANAALKKGDAKQALEWIKPMEPMGRRLPYTTAYLFQRIYGFLGNQESAEKWQRIAGERREYEKRQTALRRLMLDKPDSHGAKVVRAHYSFTTGNVAQAKMMFEQLNRDDPEDQFVRDCLASINDKERPFPSLDELPIDTQF